MAVSLLQLHHSRAACMMARTMQQAAGERERSGDGMLLLAVGWPRACPVWVLSSLRGAGGRVGRGVTVKI